MINDNHMINDNAYLDYYMYHPDFSIDTTRYNNDYRPSFFTPTLLFIIQDFMIINVSLFIVYYKNVHMIIGRLSS